MKWLEKLRQQEKPDTDISHDLNNWININQLAAEGTQEKKIHANLTPNQKEAVKIFSKAVVAQEFPTKHCTLLKPQNSQIAQFYCIQKRQCTDVNLCQVRPGSPRPSQNTPVANHLPFLSTGLHFGTIHKLYCCCCFLPFFPDFLPSSCCNRDS